MLEFSRDRSQGQQTLVAHLLDRRWDDGDQIADHTDAIRDRRSKDYRIDRVLALWDQRERFVQQRFATPAHAVSVTGSGWIAPFKCKVTATVHGQLLLQLRHVDRAQHPLAQYNREERESIFRTVRLLPGQDWVGSAETDFVFFVSLSVMPSTLLGPLLPTVPGVLLTAIAEYIGLELLFRSLSLGHVQGCEFYRDATF